MEARPEMADECFRSDSRASRRIVQAFLDFLNSVEPAPGVDFEGLEVAKDCLSEVFRLQQLPDTDRPEPNLLVNILRSQENSKCEAKGTHVENEEASTGSSAGNHGADDSTKTPKIQDRGRVRESDASGLSKDVLFGHYFDALEKTGFFPATPSGEDDQVLMDRATSLFHNAVDEMGKSGCTLLDKKSLANALKTLGNKAVQSKLYSDAIEHYTCAIALCGDNAVFYCNRAAAYTQLCKYNEAVTDSLKSIEIDPSYSKAYSRLGLAYYAQGKYREAIDRGFRKALELDPNNDAVKENIRVAEQKLAEQENRTQYQDPRYHFSGGSGSLPANIANLFSNLAGNASQSQNGQSRSAESSSGPHTSSTSDGNAIPIDLGNIQDFVAQACMNVARTFEGSNSEGQSAQRPAQEDGSFDSETGTFHTSFTYNL